MIGKKRFKKPLLPVLVLFIASSLLSSCGLADRFINPSSEPSAKKHSSGEPEPDPTHEAEQSDDPPEDSIPEADPASDMPDVYQVGELIERPTADLVVETLEERDVIVTEFDADYEPREGERLWYVDITWTNNLPEAIKKECHGPYAMELKAFDLQGREMLMVDQPGYIKDQDCSTGLMQGATGRWQTGFHSLDEEFGWLVFDDYNGELAAVVLDPDLELYYEDP